MLCNRCVDICPEYCLKLVPIEELDLEPAIKERVPQRRSDADWAALGDAQGRRRYSLRAVQSRCPTDAMTMEVFYYENRS